MGRGEGILTPDPLLPQQMRGRMCLVPLTLTSPTGISLAGYDEPEPESAAHPEGTGLKPGTLRAIELCAWLGAITIGVTGASAAQSRATTVSLAGVVRDTTGLVLPGATVELRRQGEPSPTRSTVSAADGTFVFPDVRVGAYRLWVRFPAFDPFDQTVTVAGTSPRPLMVILALSGLQEHISVVAAGLDFSPPPPEPTA